MFIVVMQLLNSHKVWYNYEATQQVYANAMIFNLEAIKNLECVG